MLFVNNIQKTFGDVNALENVSIKVDIGELVGILGPSGCGKSTLLSIIAGLIQPDNGQIFWDGYPIKNIPSYKRNFGLMFQDFALFPHMNVYQNVAFGLEMAQMDRDQIKKRVKEILDLVGLPGFESRDVNSLSGGETQRIALARSLAPNPQLLMLDEPLGSLDRNLRENLVFDLKNILHNSNQTTLYVTHDQEEVFAIADRVAIMKDGTIVQFDTPQNLYRNPETTYVAQFLGLDNFFPGRIKQDGGQTYIDTPIGRFPYKGEHIGEAVVLLRPDSVYPGNEGKYKLSGVISDSVFRGGSCRTTIKVKEESLTIEFNSQFKIPAPGEPITISFNPITAIQIFSKDE
jgi:ABC-type Fe3+/spermidine/putrescine transport system ATPase subunit